jgi:integrase
LDKVKRLDGFFEGYQAQEIDSDAIEKFKAKLQSAGKKDATINRSLSALRRMFNLARKQGKLSLKDMPSFEMLEEPEARDGFVEQKQYEALLAALPEYLKPVLTIAFFTGMRIGEVRSIQWKHVDFLEGMIRLTARQTKGKKKRAIPIFGELKRVLLAQHAKRQPGCDFVCFRTLRTGQAVGIRDFRKVWMDRCVKLDFAKWEQAVDANDQPVFAKPRGPRSKPKPKMVYRGLLVHDLRRSGIRNSIRAGVPDKVAMAISGHRTRSVFDRYNIVDERDLLDAGKKLDAYLEAKKNGPSLGQISEVSSSKLDLPS